ncbi:MAG TPA: Omp28-related outer membrane protein [Chitinophagales bacterium]|nr:Omp28-related outer membrane protein [Chitinophagales bacterium]HRG85405.1 Omp28-related outer membrane protein [Chitinophagales bacterium]HRH53443.1 Omp28-related outer membrane protein [Chitinophagales bacterium]
MKKVLLFSLVTIGLLQVSFGQYQRTVLFEEFTQASCGPCASQNPGFNALLEENSDKTLAIKYQVWWPGFDPMYLQNEPDVDSRVGYYSVSGVPDATMDGVHVPNDCAYYVGAPACVSQDDIDAAAAITSPFLINVTHSFNAEYTTVNVHVEVTAGADVAGTLKLQVAVTEKEILFNTPPGSNGETEFYGVMKKLLPSASGTTTGSFTSGETKSFDLSWDMTNIYNLNNIQIVAFMQDDASKAVLQAGVSSPAGGLPVVDYAANSVSAITCSSEYTPVVSVTNNSGAALTSLDVVYSIDGGAAATYPWTGSIAAGATGNISLPAATLVGAGSHDIEVEIVSVEDIDINMVNDNVASGISVLDVAVPSVEEGFVGATYPPANWAVDNLNDGTGWSRATGAGGYGESTTSTKADFYNIAVGTFDLYLPKLDFTNFTGDLNLVFDRAYAMYNATFVDILQVQVSEDCGATWDELYEKSGSELNTAPNTTSLFKPDDDEWETDELDMSAYAGNADVLVRFHAISGYGNNLYLDNIRIAGPTGVFNIPTLNQFELYPNPTSTSSVASFNLIEAADVTINVIDVTGKVVAAINAGNMISGSNTVTIETADFAAGMYNVVISANGKNVAFENLVVIK